MSAPPVVATPIVRLSDVTVTYGDRDVLDRVDLAIEPGERVALIGPNGAGKSTLLRVASGLLRPARGHAELGGTFVGDLDRLEVARRLAVVPQQATLPFATRVEEVVGLGRLPYEHPLRGARPADRAAIAAAIERVGVGHLLGRDVRELSLGERQLVLIALAVAQATPVLALVEVDEQIHCPDLVAQVEVDGRLVEREERRRLGDCQCDQHQLALAE